VRLSEFLALPEVEAAGVRILGECKTEQNLYKVLGPSSKLLVPITQLHHPVRVANDADDPELDEGEIASIRRRFGLPVKGLRPR
jgi:hypothetical protein